MNFFIRYMTKKLKKKKFRDKYGVKKEQKKMENGTNNPLTRSVGRI